MLDEQREVLRRQTGEVTHELQRDEAFFRIDRQRRARRLTEEVLAVQKSEVEIFLCFV